MKLNNYFLVFVFLLIGANFVCADSSYYEENHTMINNIDSVHMIVTKLRYEPYPVSPGDYFTVYVQVQKTGSEKADVQFDFVDNYPFSLDSTEESERVFSNLNNEPVVLEYKVRVDSSAISGQNTLKISQKGIGATVIHEFDINVQDVQTSFDAVVQDNTDGELSIALANIGQNDADAAIVRVPSQEGVVVSGTSGQMIGNLEQGDYTVVGFNLNTKNSVVKLQIDYTDSIGVRRSEILDIPLDGTFEGNFSSSMGRGDFPNGSMGMNNSQGSSSWYIWVIVVFVLVVVGFLGYKYRKKINHKKLSSVIPEWLKDEKGSSKK